ncbi:MAG: hypothetical protein ACI96P_002280, partial [Candidatus Azotimanducaceae bacterium]
PVFLFVSNLWGAPASTFAQGNHLLLYRYELINCLQFTGWQRAFALAFLMTVTNILDCWILVRKCALFFSNFCIYV